MSRIVSLGSAIQDIYLIDRDDFTASIIGTTSIFGQIEIGSKIDIDKISYETGGGGTNSAVTFSRFGHESIFLGNISNDSAGEAILSDLDTENVDTRFISLAQKSTGCSVILLDAKTGKRTILIYRGMATKYKSLNPDLLEEISPDWLYISTLDGDMDTLYAFVEKARKLNCKIMLHPGVKELEKQGKLLGILPEIDILLVNKQEARQLVPGQILAELTSHLKNYTDTVIITDGAMGGFASNSEESYRFGIYEDIKPKDPTGAGDAFGSGFLAALASKKSFKQSILLGSANATSVIQKVGAKRGILTGNEKLHAMPIQKAI